ncbi:MAG: NnrS family protein [Rhodocyclales bacterium]|nr:NnrS family protein [Rhodocyclales bacterium]
MTTPVPATPTFATPLWSSAFRPFYLLGPLYALVFVTAWLGAYVGAWRPPASGVPLALWHGHEMIFGFSAAIITGIVLTALPSWARTAEIHGSRLALLVALWLLGRVAMWGGVWLSPGWVLLLDGALFPALFVMLAPQLLGTRNRWYLLLLPILLALAGANVAFHLAAMTGDAALGGQALRAAVYAIVVLYVLKGGVLTPIFTGNALREQGRGEQAGFHLGLEVAAVACVVMLALFDLARAPALWVGGAAALCALVHGVRTARWQGWRVANVPLVLLMHVGFAWLVFAFVLKAVAELTGAVPEPTWMHAFTVGSLGMMMLGLMLRVSLRHTGRALVVSPAMRLACVLMLGAALLRLAATVHDLGAWVVALAALLWMAPFAIYWAGHAAILIRPSQPRDRAASGR